MLHRSSLRNLIHSHTVRHIDFEFTSTEINIPPSISSAEAVLFQVGIINDTVTEGKDEMFTAVLSSMSPDIVKVNTDAQLTTVTIQDDDSKLCFSNECDRAIIYSFGRINIKI